MKENKIFKDFLKMKISFNFKKIINHFICLRFLEINYQVLKLIKNKKMIIQNL